MMSLVPAAALEDALSSQLFSDFTLEANHQRRELKAFFLRAFNVLKVRPSPLSPPRLLIRSNR